MDFAVLSQEWCHFKSGTAVLTFIHSKVSSVARIRRTQFDDVIYIHGAGPTWTSNHSRLAPGGGWQVRSVASGNETKLGVVKPGPRVGSAVHRWELCMGYRLRGHQLSRAALASPNSCLCVQEITWVWAPGLLSCSLCCQSPPFCLRCLSVFPWRRVALPQMGTRHCVGEASSSWGGDAGSAILPAPSPANGQEHSNHFECSLSCPLLCLFQSWRGWRCCFRSRTVLSQWLTYLPHYYRLGMYRMESTVRNGQGNVFSGGKLCTPDFSWDLVF